MLFLQSQEMTILSVMNLYTKNLIFSLIIISASFIVYAEDSFVTAQSSLRQTTITGFTRARSTILLSTEFAGKIDNVFADIGDAIPETGKFACLDDTFIAIDVKSAENDMQKQAIDIAFYQKQVARHKQLVKKNTAAISVLDELKRQLGTAQRTQQGDSLHKQRLEEQRRRYCIEAPAGWQVIERYVEPGQWVNVGTLIGKASDYSRLLVPLSLSPIELAELKKQATNLKVMLPEFQQIVSASIERISPVFDEQSHKILVDLLIKDNLPDYRGGIRVELSLGTAGEMNAFFIPKQALDERYEEYWLERKDGERLRVKFLGYENNGLAKITSLEINEGDQFKILHR